MSLSIRFAQPRDVGLILEFIRELSVYEKLDHLVVADEAWIHRTLFEDSPGAETLIAEWEGEAAGFALFFHNYSTFLARKGLYLEDLFVRPAFRNQGIGKALLERLAALARERRCGRMEWSVLDWNEPAIAFYEGLGARGMNGWTVFRLEGEALQALGDAGPPA